MIHAADLTTKEVREQYVQPLLTEILEKSSLSSHAASLGLVARASFADVDVASSSREASHPSLGVQREVKTLFQEIAVEQRKIAQTLAEGDDVTSCNDAGHDFSPSSARCYAELLEEAASLSTYMTRQEHALITSIASSCLLSFLIPQCNSMGFLHSYFGPAKSRPSPSSKRDARVALSLDERLENAILSNHNNSSGGVFPYSASRMRSLTGENDDGFTSASFHRFLIQGLGAWLSTGVAFVSLSTYLEEGSNINNNDSDELLSSPSFERLIAAGPDMILLLAMAICPFPTDGEALKLMKRGNEDVASLGKYQSNILLASSTSPFSFQLSYYDRFKLAELCAEKLVVPERGDDTMGRGGTGERHEVVAVLNDLFDAALSQLRASLSCFALNVAQSDKDAMIAYRALACIAIGEQKLSTVQYEFQRLLQACMYSTSSELSLKLGDTLEDLISRYNGSRYYADGEFTRFALGILSKCIHENITKNFGNGSTGNVDQSLPDNYGAGKGAPVKRQKIDLGEDPKTANFKPYHMLALLKATRPLFFFLLDSDTAKNNENDALTALGTANEARMETSTKVQLMKDVMLLLSNTSNAPIVKVAVEVLAFALGYNAKFLQEKCNLKLLFRSTWSLITRFGISDEATEHDIIDTIKPIIVTASRQSKTFAFNLLSYAVKVGEKGIQPSAMSGRNTALKIASLVSDIHPSIATSKLFDLQKIYELIDEPSTKETVNQIKTILSCSKSPACKTENDLMKTCHSLVDRVDCNWVLFQIVHHSFASGNFRFAHHLLGDRIVRNCSTEETFLWVKGLSAMAKAESILCNGGAASISDASEAFNSAYSTICFLSAIKRKDKSSAGSFDFQIEMLRNRLDFIHLCMSTRALCTEMILAGGIPGGTRSRLFLKNCPKRFRVLATRYKDIHDKYGLHFCQQTQSTLRTLFAMCQFLGDFVDQSICESSSLNNPSRMQSSYPKGDNNILMGSLLQNLRDGALETICKSKSATFGVTELLKVMDAILQCPHPFPIGMLRTKPIPHTYVSLSSDLNLLAKKDCQTPESPSEDEYISIDDYGNEIVDTMPGIPLKLTISGIISEEFINSASIRFSQVIAWASVWYEGRPFDHDEAENAQASDDREELRFPREISRCEEPFSATLLPGGRFLLPIECDPILSEGQYRVKVRLGCRDIRCGEWSIPTIGAMELSFRVRNPW